jgi:hypothetical protein
MALMASVVSRRNRAADGAFAEIEGPDLVIV